jgi:NAD(P)-dependent dehydrogenase (short-subunit alcohol dehydrogenase family)
VVRFADLFDLHGRVALVTGAAGGLIAPMVAGLAAWGADIAAVDVKPDLPESVTTAIRESGRRCVALVADVAVTADVEGAVQKTLAEFGQIDILVNGAGFGSHSPAAEFPDTAWDRELAVNLKGAFNFCRAVGRHMISRKRGSIVNVSSIAGAIGLGRGQAAYCAAKAAVNNLTRELAVEWAPYGVRVNAIMPCQFATESNLGFLNNPTYGGQRLMATWTANIPLGRLGELWEIVGPVVFLASDASSMVTGHCLPVDGGYLAR